MLMNRLSLRAALLALPLILGLVSPASGEYTVLTSKYDSSHRISVKPHDGNVVCAGGIPNHSGWADIGQRHLFYWYYEHRGQNPNAPVMVWFTGGPGGSGQTSSLVENGDCQFDRQQQKPLKNPYGWTEEFHMVYLDQPVGVGFSYVDNETDPGAYPVTADEAAPDVIAFLRLFAQAFPHLAKNPLHLAGESYGGHWVPVFGNWIAQYNKMVPNEDRLPLASLVAMSAWSHPRTQVPALYDVACHPYKGFPPSISDTALCDAMASDYQKCEDLLQACDWTAEPFACQEAGRMCTNGFMDIVSSQQVNKYDRRMACTIPGRCYPIMEEMELWMNSDHIFDHVLDVRNQTTGKKDEFVFLREQTYRDFNNSGDVLMDTLKNVQSILVGTEIPVMFTASDADVMVNPKGLREGLETIRWRNRPLFKNAPQEELPFKTAQGNAAGLLKRTDQLWFAELADAGHMFPYDQPAAALQLIRLWLEHVSHSYHSDLSDVGKDSTQHVFSVDEL
ncbi:hypothetical protein ACHAPT_009481 [Fusarium lateritium]